MSSGETDREKRLKETLSRDMSRHDRRASDPGGFWRALGVMGMVGWPIALLTFAGAWLGHRIDVRYATGIRFTLMLLTLGAVIGSAIAWKAISERSNRHKL